MRLIRRSCQILRHEGLSGVSQRIAQALTRRRRFKFAQEEYRRSTEAFLEKARQLGHGDLSRYRWYHTVDLGHGLVTPGDYDYRSTLSDFRFAEDMTGMHVMDVGAATGFFSFEFERRGALVTAVDLSSATEWDFIPFGANKQALPATSSVQQGHDAFQFCKKVLNARVEKVHSRVYDLSPARVGRDGFDMVFLGDVLPHLFSPLAALRAVAPLCKKLLVLTLDLWPSLTAEPGLLFVGEDHEDSWWRPNWSGLEKMLRRVGFASVKVVGKNQGLIRRRWSYMNRPVVFAYK